MREIKFRGYKQKHFGCENCLSGKRKTTGGYSFTYENPELLDKLSGEENE